MMDVFGEFVVTLTVAFGAGAIVVALAPRFGRREFSISTRTANLIFVALGIGYALVFGSLSILRHDSFHSNGFDLGIFDQVAWNSLNGRLFENTIEIGFLSHLGIHLSPILIGLVPLYAIWSDARVLLITQTLALSISGVPVYWYARKTLGATLAVMIAFAYFLFPALQYVNLFEFHEIALATPLLAFGLYFLLRRHFLPFLVCLFVALLAKEEIAFVVVALGIYLLFVMRQHKLGTALVLFGITYAVIAFKYVIPFFLGASYDANSFILLHYRYLGSTLSEIITTTLTQPGLVIQHLLVPLKIEFVLQLLVPVLFIPLLGMETFALSVPTLGYLLIADFDQNPIHYQYTAPIIPFLFFALVIGLKRLCEWKRTPIFQTVVAVCLVVATSTNYFFQAAGPLARGFDPAQYALGQRVMLGHQLLAQIPADAPTMAEANLVPHLSDRRFIYQAPNTFNLRSIEYLLSDDHYGPRKEYQSTWQDVLASPFFETLVAQDGYTLKKRAPYVPAQPLAIQFDDQITLFGYTVESSQPATRGDSARIVLTWRADQNIRERYVAFVHLVNANQGIVAQDDHEPANGWFRTDRWNAGDVTPDRFTLELPADLPAGEYRITTGFYRTSDQQNLSAHDPRGNPLGVAPTIGTLIVK